LDDQSLFFSLCFFKRQEYFESIKKKKEGGDPISCHRIGHVIVESQNEEEEEKLGYVMPKNQVLLLFFKSNQK